jgi:hypothetical protein
MLLQFFDSLLDVARQPSNEPPFGSLVGRILARSERGQELAQVAALTFEVAHQPQQFGAAADGRTRRQNMALVGRKAVRRSKRLRQSQQT